MIKKIVFTIFISFFVIISAFAHNIYFDAGIGAGIAGSTTKEKDIGIDHNSTDLKVSRLFIPIGLFGFHFGIKVGYGPFGNIPIYTILEISEMINYHVSIFSETSITYFTNTIGPGIIFYPKSIIQLSATIGFSSSYVIATIDEITNPSAKRKVNDTIGYGFAWNISLAFDIGKRNYGCIFGIRFFNSLINAKKSNDMVSTTMFGTFVKYTYRRKV